MNSPPINNCVQSNSKNVLYDINIMRKCSNCELPARLKCTVCNIILCQDHRFIHINNHQDHNIVRYKFFIDPDLKNRVFESLKFKINIIDQSYNEVIISTDKIITKIYELSQLALQKLGDSKNAYINLLKEMNEEVVVEREKQIKKGLKSVIIVEKLESIDNFMLWIKQDIVLEKPRSFFPWEEEDLIGISIQLVTDPNIIENIEERYVKMTRIDNEDWVYNGNIENHLPNGRGSLIFEGDAYELGEWKQGMKDGIGVKKMSDGFFYYGEWKKDLQDGNGIYKRQDGQFFDQEWENGEIRASVNVKYRKNISLKKKEIMEFITSFSDYFNGRTLIV